MHFQLPPAAHAKLVYCIVGKVLDVVLDLRKDSATFGRSYAHELNGTNREMLFISAGFAHGFLALEDQATMVYQTSTVHSPAQDAGIAWNSFGFDWPVKNPILSERDKNVPALGAFLSPFWPGGQSSILAEFLDRSSLRPCNFDPAEGLKDQARSCCPFAIKTTARCHRVHRCGCGGRPQWARRIFCRRRFCRFLPATLDRVRVAIPMGLQIG